MKILKHKITKEGVHRLKLLLEADAGAGKKKNEELWSDLKNAWTDCEVDGEDVHDNLVVLYAKEQKNMPKDLYLKIAEVAGVAFESLFPEINAKDHEEDNVEEEEEEEEEVELPTCDCQNHEVYDNTAYNDVVAYYFKDGQKYNEIQCRICKQLPEKWKTQPTNNNPAKVCNFLYLDRVKCPDGIVCPDCWKVQSVVYADQNGGSRKTRRETK